MRNRKPVKVGYSSLARKEELIWAYYNASMQFYRLCRVSEVIKGKYTMEKLL